MTMLSNAHKLNLQQRSWKVIYTRPRWEKKVDTLLQASGVESYCPLKKESHKWADRNKIVHLPIFSSYVFVHSNLKEELLIRQTLGVINFIYFEGRPATLTDAEINRIRDFIVQEKDMEIISVNQLSAGDRVRIKSGALESLSGEVLQVQGKNVLMVLDHLGCMIITKVATHNTILA